MVRYKGLAKNRAQVLSLVALANLPAARLASAAGQADPQGATRLSAPIAPGLIDAVGIAALETLVPDTAYRPEIAAGALALDGERELTFSEADEVSIWSPARTSPFIPTAC